MHYIIYIRYVSYILVIKGYRDLQASHFMLPDEPLLALATHDEYKYRQTYPGNSRSFRVGKTLKNMIHQNRLIESKTFENNKEIGQCYGHQSAVNAPIQVYAIGFHINQSLKLLF